MKKLMLIIAIPMAFILLACGPYGGRFDFEGYRSLKPGESTLTEVESFLIRNRYSWTVASEISYGEEPVLVKTLSVTQMGLRMNFSTLLSEIEKKQKGVDPVMGSLLISAEFPGWGPGYLQIGASSLEQVQKVMDEPGERTGDRVYFPGKRIAVEVVRQESTGEEVISQVELGV